MKRLEHWVALVLCAMLCVVVILATVELGIVLVRDIARPPVLLPGIDELLDLFSQVLLVVMGIELVETMRVFATEGIARLEAVISIAAIALARRVVVMEPGHVATSTYFGVAALFAALAIAYRAFVR